LANDFSLLQNTLRRLEGLPGLGIPIAVANEIHRFLLMVVFLLGQASRKMDGYLRPC